MKERRTILQDPVQEIDKFYENIMCNRDTKKYIKIRLRDKKEDENMAIYKYECFHTEILTWLKPFVSKTFYNSLLHYQNELCYDKMGKKLKFIIHDYEDKIYYISGVIHLEKDMTTCLITVTFTHFSMKLIPYFVKNKIINEIMDEIEAQITHKN